MEHQTVTIIGAGIAGLTTAIALNRIGIETQIFEATNKIEPVGAGLGLGLNAMKAFKALGIYEEVLGQGKLLPSFSIYDPFGKIISKTNFDKELGSGTFSIHRATLHQLLLSKLDPSTIHLGKRIESFESTDFAVKLKFEDGSTYLSNYVIVADGIHSVIRQQLVPDAKIRYSGYTCWRAIIKNPQLLVNEASETWGANGRFGIVPLADNYLYWFACVNAAAEDPHFKSYQVVDIYNRFKKYHGHIPKILKASINANLIQNDISDIIPLNHFAFGRIVLIGDAAHATTPNMGQGACQAIEDAVIIAKSMSEISNYEHAFLRFEKHRLKRTKWIIDKSRQIGKLAQLEAHNLIAIRNTLLRCMPDALGKNQIKKIEEVDFENISN